MKLTTSLASLLIVSLLAGCATFNDTELGIIRGSGVSPHVYAKVQDGRPLHPEEVIELTRRHVPDRYILRQIDDAGVDYVLSPADHKRLREAHVSPAVIDALVTASDDFASRYAAPNYRIYAADPYAYDYPYGYGDYYGPGVYPVVTGEVGIGFSSHHHGCPHR